MTPKETGFIQEAYCKSKELNSREKWELARYNAYFGLLPHQGKGKNLEPTDLGKFEWERKEAGERPTYTKEEELFFEKMGNKKNKTRLLKDDEIEKSWQ